MWGLEGQFFVTCLGEILENDHEWEAVDYLNQYMIVIPDISITPDSCPSPYGYASPVKDFSRRAFRG